MNIAYKRAKIVLFNFCSYLGELRTRLSEVEFDLVKQKNENIETVVDHSHDSKQEQRLNQQVEVKFCVLFSFDFFQIEYLKSEIHSISSELEKSHVLNRELQQKITDSEHDISGKIESAVQQVRARSEDQARGEIEAVVQSYVAKIHQIEQRLRSEEDLRILAENKLKEIEKTQNVPNNDSKFELSLQMIAELQEQLEEQRSINRLLKDQLNERFS